MIRGRALVVGAARNCAAGLKATLPRLERFNETFDEVDYVIVTNDSNDETEQVLTAWAAARTNVEIIVLLNVVQNIPQRTARLAVVRNICLSRLYRQNDRHYDYFLVADLDGVNSELVEEPAFSDAIARAPEDWGGLFANQRTRYYDVWALRHPTWCPYDCWQEVEIASRGLFRRKAKRTAAISKFVKDRQKQILAETGPIKVDSAFGGLGIYKVASLDKAYYLGLSPQDNTEVCEHVFFHRQIQKNGYMLYIMPSILNEAPESHV